jgi:hypothetical protein
VSDYQPQVVYELEKPAVMVTLLTEKKRCPN